MTRKRIKLPGFVVAGLMLLSVAGCADRVRSKMVGTWEVQKADRIGKRINQADGESASRMRMVFESGGGLRTQTLMGEIQREKTGTWKLASFDEQADEMGIDCDLGSGEVNVLVSFIDDDTIRLVPPNMAGTRTKLTFVRKK